MKPKNINPEQWFTIYFDGSLSPEQQVQFKEWLKADIAHVRQFVEASYIHRGMYDILCGQDAQKLISGDIQTESICADDFWKALLDEEKNAPSVEREQADNCKPDLIVPDRSQVHISRGRINRFAWGTAFASLAAFFFLLVYVFVNPRTISEPVACVTDVVRPDHHDLDPVFRPGSRLYTRQGVWRLDEGIVKIKFDNGADVVIEGPSEFELLTYDEIAFHSGRLYAHVPKRALGFIVSTANAKIIDLGTGFGVSADKFGNTDVHVLDGKVSLVSGTRSDVRNSQLVSVNEACRVERDSEVIRPVAFRADTFVQDINSKTQFVWRGQPLDMADMAGGGNGLGTGRINVSIDFSTGKLTNEVPRERFKQKTPYVLVPEIDYIDGVFIPEGSKGPIQVTSEGHRYECPPTLGESYYGVFNGSVLPLKTGERGYIDHSVQYRGNVYGIAGRPVLFLHSNLGVTFDLDKIRRSLPVGGRLAGFSARCALVEGPEGSKRENDYTDFYVLVDGAERFSAVDMNYLSEMKPVELKLNDGDRFLTLMTTEGKDGNLHMGWSFFAEPRLYFEVTGQ